MRAHGWSGIWLNHAGPSPHPVDEHQHYPSSSGGQADRLYRIGVLRAPVLSALDVAKGTGWADGVAGKNVSAYYQRSKLRPRGSSAGPPRTTNVEGNQGGWSLGRWWEGRPGQLAAGRSAPDAARYYVRLGNRLRVDSV